MILIKFLRNISLFSFSVFLPQVSNFFLLPFTTKHLTNSDFYIYGTVLAYNLLLQGLKSLGTDVVFINSFFKDKLNWKKTWSKYLGIRFIWKHIFLVIQFLFLYLFIELDDLVDNKINVILLLVLSDYFFSVSNDVGARYYISAKKPKLYFKLTIISVFFSSVVNYYLIIHCNYGYLSWFIASFVFAFISYVYNFYYLFFRLKLFPKFNFDLEFLTNTLKVSLPLVPHNYSSFLLHSSDRIVLDKLNVNNEDIGNYNIAYMIVNVFDRFGDAVGFVINPIVNEFFAKHNEDAEFKARNFLFTTQVFFILITTSFALLSKEIFSFFFNDIYNENISLIATIMVMGMTFRPMYWATVNKLMFYEKTNIIWKISTVSGFLNVFLNLVFIPVFGLYTAVITTNICLLILGFSGFFLREYKKIQVVNYHEFIWLTFIIVITVFITIAQSLTFEIRITIVILINLFSGFMFFSKRRYLKLIK